MKLKKFLITIALVTSTVTILSGCADTEESSYMQGVVALERSDYDNAKVLFERAISEGESEKKCYRGLGLASMEEGDYRKASDNFVKALSYSNGIIDDTDIDISYYMAVSSCREGKYQDSISTLDAIIAISPNRDTAYYLRGKVKLAIGDKAGAIEDYNKAIELAPGDYDHYVRICEDLREYGYVEDSNMYIEKAMSQAGKLNDYRKGVFEYYLGSYTDARNDFENARKSNETENLDIYLGRTYEALGDIGYASSIYESALLKYPDSGRLYNQMALIKIIQKDYNGALDLIEQGINLGNGEAMQGLMFNRVVAYEYLYDFDKAKVAMEDYLSKYPGDVKARREYTFLSSR